jgi:hypothetical protein
MNPNEREFLNYWYNKVVLNRLTNLEVINQGYFLLHGEQPADNCGPCVKNRKQKLDNMFVSLRKFEEPVDEMLFTDITEVIASASEEQIDELIDIIKPKKKKKLEDTDTSYYGENINN